MPLEPDREIDFRACTVRIFDGWIETRFKADGSTSHFHPPIDAPDFRSAANEMGYVDPWLYAQEHDICHALVADALGWDHSPSVWAAAHGKTHKADGTPFRMSERVAYDEHLTNRLQAYMNTGRLDDEHGCLVGAFGRRLSEVARKALLTCRPWLVCAKPMATIEGRAEARAQA